MTSRLALAKYLPPSRMQQQQQPQVDSQMASSATAKHDNPRSVKRVAVVGAGVSGLAAAYKLKSHGLDVTVFEADGRAGGRLKSVSQDGLVWDEGANTMIENGMEVTGLIDALGLQEKQQFPISQHKRYIVKNGTPLLVPTNPVALLQSKLLSAQSKVSFSNKSKNIPSF